MKLKLSSDIIPGHLSFAFRVLCWVVWAAALILLPITSLPWLSDHLGGTTVASPSAFLFLILLGMWLPFYLLHRGRLPGEAAPFMFFLAVILVSWAAAFFREMPYFRGYTQVSEIPETFATLALAVAAFFAPVIWLRVDKNYLGYSVQIINLGGIFLLVWCLVQVAYTVLGHGSYPFTLVQFQWLFSMRPGGPLFADRITGFAYEPSWLAHQLNLIYLPLWLSATLQRFSAHRWRLWHLSLENMLLICGVIALFFSVSRVGWLSFLLVLAIWSLASLLRWTAGLQQRLFPTLSQATQMASRLVILAVTMFVFVAVGYGMLQVGAKFEPRLQRILDRNIFHAANIYEVFNNLEFAERVIYWDAGLRTFANHWFLGTGIGNSGFYFTQNVASFGWMLPEVVDVINRFSYLPNIKSLWVRILAETGLVGFAFFVGWYYLLWQSARQARRSSQPLIATLGMAGGFVLLAFLVEGFSIDSFALPYFWFAAGLLVAARAAAASET